MRREPSALADARRRPSGLKLRLDITPLCPLRRGSSLSLPRSQSATVESEPQEAMTFASGLIATQRGLDLLSNWRTSLPIGNSINLILRSQLLEVNHRPSRLKDRLSTSE